MATLALNISGRLATGETLRAWGAGTGDPASLHWQALINGTWTDVGSPGSSTYTIPAGAAGLSYRLASVDEFGLAVFSPATGFVVADSKKSSAPVLAGPDLSTIGYESPEARSVFSWLTFSDADKGNYGGGTLVLQDSTSTLYGGDGHDVLSIAFYGPRAGEFSYVAATREVKYTFTNPSGNLSTQTVATLDAALDGNGTDLKLTFTNNATQAVVDALVDRLQVTNADDSPTLARILTLRITDPSGASAQRVTSMWIENTPDAPVFTGAVTFQADENQLAVGTVHAIDPDRESNQPQGVTFSLVDGAADNARFAIDAGGTLSFRSAPDYEDPFHAPVYTAVVRATDADGATTDQQVTVTLRNVNEAPVTFDMHLFANEDGAPITFAPTIFDPDAGDIVYISVNTAGLRGQLTREGDHYVYDPNGQFESAGALSMPTDAFRITLTDAGGLSTTRTITIHIVGENDPATITGQSTATLEEVASPYAFYYVSGHLAVSDIDAGENLLDPSHGPNTGPGTFTVSASGDWFYTVSALAMQALAPGQVVHDTVNVSSWDGTATQLLDVSLVGVYPPPPLLEPSPVTPIVVITPPPAPTPPPPIEVIVIGSPSDTGALAAVAPISAP